LAGIDAPVDRMQGRGADAGADDVVDAIADAASGSDAPATRTDAISSDADPGDAPHDGGWLGTITRISVSVSMGTQADGDSTGVSVSGDGSLVAFSSSATNLDYADFNGKADVFTYDLKSASTRLVTVQQNGASPNADCTDPIVTANGTEIVFASAATNLVDSANKGTRQIFSMSLTTMPLVIFHRSTSTSDAVTGAAANADANMVAFETASVLQSAVGTAFDDNGLPDVYVVYGGRSSTERVSIGMGGAVANGDSHGSSISAVGNAIAFWSNATNIVADDRNAKMDVFVRVLANVGCALCNAGSNVRRVSVSTAGDEGNGASGPAVISGDGSRVAFCSDATNLVPSDTNGVEDVFVHDLMTHETVRVSVSSAGAEANDASCSPSLSGNGRVVAFTSVATNLLDDPATRGEAKREHVFVHDLVTGTTTRLTMGVGGAPANGRSYGPRISANGRVLVFLSEATNLVLGDTNGHTDAFAYEFTSAPWLGP
jgi:hypothetical protein